VPQLRARVIVSGRVQGVWFRESTRRRAEALGVGGWVRNLADGSVEALFEGEAEQVCAALAFVREGPPLARVREVVVAEEREVELAPGPRRFEIRRGTL
jgi:acylphosphatase